MVNRNLFSPSIYTETLVAVFRAFLANRLGNNKWIPLPPVACKDINSPPIDELVSRVDKIVRFAIFNTAHPCLYYSYARCRILRKSGYSVKLNIGLHNLTSNQQTEGHCWLSSNGKVLFEDSDPHEMYSDSLGERNDVVYWTRLQSEDGKSFKRTKKN